MSVMMSGSFFCGSRLGRTGGHCSGGGSGAIAPSGRSSPRAHWQMLCGIDQRGHGEKRRVGFYRAQEAGGRRRDAIVALHFRAPAGLEAVDCGVRLRVRQVPFAEVGGVVAGLPEDRPHHGETAGVYGRGVVRLDARLGRIASGEHGCPRGHAERVGAVGAREDGAGGGEAVHVRRVEVLAPDAAAQRVGELLVRHHDQDIRPCGGAAERRQERRGGGGFQEGSPVHNNPGSTSITGRCAVDCGYARFRRIHCGFLSCCFGRRAGAENGGYGAGSDAAADVAGSGGDRGSRARGEPGGLEHAHAPAHLLPGVVSRSAERRPGEARRALAAHHLSDRASAGRDRCGVAVVLRFPVRGQLRRSGGP